MLMIATTLGRYFNRRSAVIDAINVILRLKALVRIPQVIFLTIVACPHLTWMLPGRRWSSHTDNSVSPKRPTVRTYAQRRTSTWHELTSAWEAWSVHSRMLGTHCTTSVISAGQRGMCISLSGASTWSWPASARRSRPSNMPTRLLKEFRTLLWNFR